MDELERAKPYYGNEFKVLKKNCFGEEGGGGGGKSTRTSWKTFLILSVVSYWFEIAVRGRRECLAKTLTCFYV
jgi:hypothetical protein